MVFGRLGKRVKNLLSGEAHLELRIPTLREERMPLVLEDSEFYLKFRPATADLEEARSAGRAGQSAQAAEALSDHFRDRIRPNFFVHHATSASILGVLRERRQACQLLMQEAEKALAHQFTPLGAEPFSFGSAIDWFSDFEGRSWVFAHVEDLKQQLKRPSDPTAAAMGAVELTWEFNRHGHFLDMARAYWLSDSEPLVSEFIVQAVDWSERNPGLGGINWLDPETVAIRTVHWLLALHYFLKSAQLHGEPFARLIKELMVHAAILADLIERTEGRAKLACCSSLLLYSLAMPEVSDSERWHQLAASRISEAAWQVLGRDGFDASGCSAQHRATTEWLLLPLMLCKLNQLPAPEGLQQAAETALDNLLLLMPANGLAPELGSTWASSFLGRNCGTARHLQRLLAFGAIATGQGRFLQQQDMPAELYWWLGLSARERFASLSPQEPAAVSRALAEAGLLVARDNWSSQANWCLLRGTPASTLSQAAPPVPAELPLHDDALSLCLSLEGEPVLLEPGAPPLPGAVGQAFSRILAHSAPRIGREREPICLARSGHEETPKMTIVETREGFYLGTHRSVWLMPDKPWKLHREILFMPEKKRIAIRDRLDAEAEVHLESNLLLAPHLDVLMRGDMGCLLRGKRLQARVVPIFPGRFRYELLRGSMKPFAGWIWSEAKKPVAAHRLRYFTRIKSPFSIYLWLVWDPNDTKVPREEELDRMYAEATR